MTPATRARSVGAIAAGVLGMHLLHLAAAAAHVPVHTAPVLLSAGAWAAVLAVCVASLRGRGLHVGRAALLLTGGGAAVTVDGALSGTPGQELLVAVGLTGLVLGLGVFSSRRGAVLAVPVLLACQAVLVLAHHGTGLLGVYLAVSTASVSGAVFAIVMVVQHGRTTALAALAELADHDPLTGLLNRRGMVGAFPALRAAVPAGSRVAVLIADVDRFKAVNDEHGHDAGDATLVAVADVLRRTARGADLAVRLGGEEFAWIGSWPDAASAAAAAERWREAVAAAAPTHGPGVTVSVGVAHSTDLTQTLSHAEALSRLLVRSDRALYAAKEAGRDRVVLAADTWPSATDRSSAPAATHGAPVPLPRDGGSVRGSAEASATSAAGPAERGQRA